MSSIQFRRCYTCSRCCCCCCYCCWSSSAYRFPSSVHPYTCQLSRRGPSTSNRSPLIPRRLLSGFSSLSGSCWQFPLTRRLTHVTRPMTSERDNRRLIHVVKITLIVVISVYGLSLRLRTRRQLLSSAAQWPSFLFRGKTRQDNAFTRFSALLLTDGADLSLDARLHNSLQSL